MTDSIDVVVVAQVDTVAIFDRSVTVLKACLGREHKKQKWGVLEVFTSSVTMFQLLGMRQIVIRVIAWQSLPGVDDT